MRRFPYNLGMHRPKARAGVVRGMLGGLPQAKAPTARGAKAPKKAKATQAPKRGAGVAKAGVVKGTLGSNTQGRYRLK